jgi:hypothetical protein
VMCTLLQPALFSQPGIHGGAGAEDDHLVCVCVRELALVEISTCVKATTRTACTMIQKR